jgi:tight adherence protein B
VSPLTWLALALVVLLVPMTDPALTRARTLSEHGRLVGPARPPVRYRLPRPEVAAVVGCIAAAVGIAVVAGPVLGAAAAVATLTATRLGLAALRSSRERRVETDLLTALRLIAAELEAGSRPTAALQAASEACPDHREAFVAAAEAVHAGHDPPFAPPALRALSRAWSVATVTGAPLAAVVGRVADDLAARVDQRRAVTAAVAGARSTAGLLAGLPALGLLLGAAMQAHPLDVLLATPAGQLLCLVGVALDATGVLWTMRLTARAERP